MVLRLIGYQNQYVCINTEVFLSPSVLVLWKEKKYILIELKQISMLVSCFLYVYIGLINSLLKKPIRRTQTTV